MVGGAEKEDSFSDGGEEGEGGLEGVDCREYMKGRERKDEGRGDWRLGGGDDWERYK